FRADLKEKSRNTRCNDDAQRWSSAAGPNLVVIRDPLAPSDADCGTYYVFRKLEQNVKGFRKRLEKLADRLHLVGVDRKLAGALVIGRFPNGTPVALRKHSDVQWKSPANHFLYPKVDKYGTRCPFFAHIRKANPRGDDIGSTLCDQIKHRIARRGIPYGNPTCFGKDLDGCPENGVGLLFQSCQADLGSQFE